MVKCSVCKDEIDESVGIGHCDNCGKPFHTGTSQSAECFIDLPFELGMWQVKGTKQLIEDYNGELFKGCQMICMNCAERYLDFVG
jgi:predicted amidophosphoribosyltransferase